MLGEVFKITTIAPSEGGVFMTNEKQGEVFLLRESWSANTETANKAGPIALMPVHRRPHTGEIGPQGP